jgi:hypothetical protein
MDREIEVGRLILCSDEIGFGFGFRSGTHSFSIEENANMWACEAMRP